VVNNDDNGKISKHTTVLRVLTKATKFMEIIRIYDGESKNKWKIL
jgi:hypothetical protein